MPKETWHHEKVSYHVEKGKIVYEGKSRLAEMIAEHNIRPRMKEILSEGKSGMIAVKWVK